MQTNTINIQIESCFMSLKLLSVQYKSKVIQIMKKINANVNVNKQKKIVKQCYPVAISCYCCAYKIQPEHKAMSNIDQPEIRPHK